MSRECLITKQFSSRLFNCDIAMSKTFEYRPVKNRTIRYAAICVLSGNVAFGQNFIPHVDTCQSAMKSFFNMKTSANRILVLSKHQGAASRKCEVASVMMRYLSGKLAIFKEFRYSLSIFPSDTRVLPSIIVEICRGKPEEKKTEQNKTKQKQTLLIIFDHLRHLRPSFFIVTKSVSGGIQSESEASQFIVICKWPVSRSICQPVSLSASRSVICQSFNLQASIRSLFSFIHCIHSVNLLISSLLYQKYDLRCYFESRVG